MYMYILLTSVYVYDYRSKKNISGLIWRRSFDKGILKKQWKTTEYRCEFMFPNSDRFFSLNKRWSWLNTLPTLLYTYTMPFSDWLSIGGGQCPVYSQSRRLYGHKTTDSVHGTLSMYMENVLQGCRYLVHVFVCCYQMSVVRLIR